MEQKYKSKYVYCNKSELDISTDTTLLILKLLLGVFGGRNSYSQWILFYFSCCYDIYEGTSYIIIFQKWWSTTPSNIRVYILELFCFREQSTYEYTHVSIYVTVRYLKFLLFHAYENWKLSRLVLCPFGKYVCV